ncbi:OmpA family protein [Flavobacterium sp. SUN046]|uniref:OmpA family protein n=1 Tax=Flavobacterium sp. SUN046 TaxID=3002440 RepID=UPI002DB9BFDC|nr:OmpA family protein [Flavobacterium sp. SUN046]MEC4049951.1 OmpA family protein [Flavobacterium sp. SUN046]
MNKIYIIGVLVVSMTLVAQENNNSFNRWSIEANVGLNKPVRPYTENYYSSNPKNYFNFSPVNHFNIGARYMMSEVFGAKLDFSYDKMENQKNSQSLPFQATQYNISLQGVVNLGNLLQFYTFTNRFNLLAHGGVSVSQFTPKMGVYKNITEDNGGVVLGLTPQLRITNRIVLTGDFSTLTNVRQHYNWDGMSLSNRDNNLTGLLYTTSLGLTFYLGGNETHADWYVKEGNNKDAPTTDIEARKRIAELEKMMNDVDRDGVPDYLDAQNNTPNGVIVDAKGRFIDTNKNGVPDELESNSTANKNEKPLTETSDAMRSLVEKGYVNIFFDVNQDFPNTGSTNTVFQMIQFLKSNPTIKVKLFGYADLRGGENTNKELSNRRAQNVYKILIASGINKNRIDTKAQGVDKSFTADDKGSLNLARRVSVILE